MENRIVGKKSPFFEMEAVMPNGEFGKVSLEENIENGKWTVLFFYPMDFTFVCPTEIIAMSEAYEKFKSLNTEVIGASTDSVHTHLAWIKTPRNENGIGKLKYPLASDVNHQISKKYNVLIEEEGITLRGLFIINPKGELMYQVVVDNNVGRSVDETLRILQALQTGGLCPINWKPGDKTL